MALDLDQLTRTHTAFATFAALIDAKGGYRPLLQGTRFGNVRQEGAELSALADAYDQAQVARNDPRRAVRDFIAPPNPNDPPKPPKKPRPRPRPQPQPQAMP